MKTFKEYILEGLAIKNSLDEMCTKINTLLMQNKEVPNKYITYIIDYVDNTIDKHKNPGAYHSYIWRFGHLFLDTGNVIPKDIVDHIIPANALDLMLFAIQQPQLTKKIPVELLKNFEDSQIKDFKDFMIKNKTPEEIKTFVKSNRWALELFI